MCVNSLTNNKKTTYLIDCIWKVLTTLNTFTLPPQHEEKEKFREVTLQISASDRTKTELLTVQSTRKPAEQCCCFKVLQ